MYLLYRATKQILIHDVFFYYFTVCLICEVRQPLTGRTETVHPYSYLFKSNNLQFPVRQRLPHDRR